MAMIRGNLFFAPGVQMAGLDFDDCDSLIDAFAKRVKGLFIEPIQFLRNAPRREGALFASALLTAALIESIARAEEMGEEEQPIAAWLLRRVPEFEVKVGPEGARTAADIFEERFRNGLAHSGYVASLGRLSEDIGGTVQIAGGIVTVNPFLLVEAVEAAFDKFLSELRDGRRDKRRFAYNLKEQFQGEVKRAKKEATAIRRDLR